MNRLLMNCIIGGVMLTTGVMSCSADETKVDASTPINEERLCFNTDSTMLIGMEQIGDGIKVHVEILDPSQQMRAMRQGLNVYLDQTAKKKQKYSIQFPTSNVQMGGRGMGMQQGDLQGQRPQGRPQGRPEGLPEGLDDDMPFDGEMGEPGGNPAQMFGGQIRMAVATLANEPTSFLEDKKEKMIALENTKISYTDDNRLVFVCYLPQAWLGTKKDKKGRFAMGLSIPQPKMLGFGGGPGGGGMMGGGPGGGMGGRGGGMAGPGGGMGGPGGGMGGRGGGMGGPGAGMGGPGGAPGSSSDSSKPVIEWIVIE